MDYQWQKHPEAILGLVYLYVVYGKDPSRIPHSEIDAFINRHQDGGALNKSKLKTAIKNQANIDAGRNYFRGSKVHRKIWKALKPFLS